MSFAVIAVSGTSGGMEGPCGLYERLQRRSQEGNFGFHPINTIPDDIEGNVSTVVGAAAAHSWKYQNTYIMGYSMGAAVAVIAAERLLEEQRRPVDGVILLSPQTEGLEFLYAYPIPSLIFHGTADRLFPLYQIEKIHKKCIGRSRAVWMQDLDHEWRLPNQYFVSTPYVERIAVRVFEEIQNFHLSQAAPMLVMKSNSSFQPSLSLVERGVNRAAGVFRRFFSLSMILLLMLQAHRKISDTVGFLLDLFPG